jgi:hypothetical protein
VGPYDGRPGKAQGQCGPATGLMASDPQATMHHRAVANECHRARQPATVPTGHPFRCTHVVEPLRERCKWFAKSNRSLLEFGWLNVKYCQLVSTNFYFCKEIIFKRYTEMHICKLDCLVELYTYTVSLEIVTFKIRADEKKPLVFFWKL